MNHWHGTNDETESFENVRQLAHDLRGCLSTIKMATEILRRAGEDPARREKVVSMLERQGECARAILEELVEVVRKNNP